MRELLSEEFPREKLRPDLGFGKRTAGKRTWCAAMLAVFTLNLGHSAVDAEEATQESRAQEPTGENLPEGRDYFVLRGGLDNCRISFEREKKGRVVFMGGSITNMNGWRQMVCQDLQRRFPDTKFDFVNAGIPSTGSVPGAFRLLRDVFGKGPVDLLFEEAGVNDATNRPGNRAQWRRGMEGIVRQARTVNPNLDIVVMHFVDPGKMAAYNRGETPDVIEVHEAVAQHYQASSINLAEEVTGRIRAGQFTWKDDFRNLHPSPFGHRLYAGTIGRMFDAAWSKAPASDAGTKPHPMPEKPLDPFSYFEGRLVDLAEAKLLKGWRHEQQWKPEDKAGTRSGFVNVPALVAEQPGSELSLKFHGRAAALWIAAGPDVGVLECRIDQGEWKSHDQFTRWSRGLHLPWTLVLADELVDDEHELTLRTTERKNTHSRGHACRIVNFCITGKTP